VRDERLLKASIRFAKATCGVSHRSEGYIFINLNAALRDVGGWAHLSSWIPLVKIGRLSDGGNLVNGIVDQAIESCDVIRDRNANEFVAGCVIDISLAKLVGRECFRWCGSSISIWMPSCGKYISVIARRGSRFGRLTNCCVIIFKSVLLSLCHIL